MASRWSAVFVALPRASLFAFPPSSRPGFLAPPPPGSMASAPAWAIPERVYEAALDARVPLTVALLYTVAAKLLNAYNKARDGRAWWVARTRGFGWFVVAHNVLLALYSAWTWWGMLGALRRSVVSPLGRNGAAAFVDSVCRVNGPAGLGSAAFYSEATATWHTHSSVAALAALAGDPSRRDAGRLWNEGLAFYGWLFYLSKFYEVIDTLIILAKGRLSSTLQTYHHAGAMMCMWAGMRYMSPPIWMFVFVNSGIHAIMYTYYTLTAFNVRVPVFVKRTLTTLQITQFLVGASYAMLHSFVYYTVPTLVAVHGDHVNVNVDVDVGVNLHADASPSPGHHNASLSAATTVLRSIKTLLFGASPPSPSPADAARLAYAQRAVPCITTTGATMAIWLNVLYLAPLTYLFASFFVESYLRRTSAGAKTGRKDAATHAAHPRRLSGNVQLAEKAGWDAARSVEQEMYGQGDDAAHDGTRRGRRTSRTRKRVVH